MLAAGTSHPAETEIIAGFWQASIAPYKMGKR
jgi:hypothetical protein